MVAAPIPAVAPLATFLITEGDRMAISRNLAAVFIWMILAVPFTAASGAETVVVGSFSQGSLTGWEKRSFKGETTYALVRDPVSSKMVLQAASNASASGRFKKISVDLTKTPYLNWSWKVANALPGLDENAKAGDDFAARVYVVSERGLMGVNSLSVNYVWSSQKPTGNHWTSPFTRQVRLIAVNSGSNGLNTWISHKRNVRADLKRMFGEDFASIDAVALMTDTDNSGQRATASYGDIWFSAD